MIGAVSKAQEAALQDNIQTQQHKTGHQSTRTEYNTAIVGAAGSAALDNWAACLKVDGRDWLLLGTGSFESPSISLLTQSWLAASVYCLPCGKGDRVLVSLCFF